MADEEAESGAGCPGGRATDLPGLGQRLQELEEVLRRSGEPSEQAASGYCQRFCQTLLEYAEKWKASDDHLPLLEVYTDAIQSYSKARKYLTSECENVPVVLERLSLSCAEILLGLPHDLPDKHWKGFQTSIQIYMRPAILPVRQWLNSRTIGNIFRILSLALGQISKQHCESIKDTILVIHSYSMKGHWKPLPSPSPMSKNSARIQEEASAVSVGCRTPIVCDDYLLRGLFYNNLACGILYEGKGAYRRLQENGILELHFLYILSLERGVWKNPVLHSILNEESVGQDKVNQFLTYESPILLEMRIKHLLKTNQIAQATTLAKLCSEHQDLKAKSIFKQMYLVCLCSQSPNIQFIEEIAKIDCKDALEMICNLESEGDEKTALIICAAFLSRQLQHGEMDCAWELTLFWSKLQQRVDPSVQVYLERCRQLSLLTKTVYHIFFLIKIIQSETEGAGLATCIELCVKALRLESGENANVKISICKTISCLLPDDLEVKRACQLSEFLLEPTVDAYYAVEMLYNQPDQKYDEDSLPVPNSLRCELLLVLKTRWPFDPEFWDWKTLKRQCLALMGEEASIVSSIDELNDSEVYEKLEDSFEDSKESSFNEISNSYFSADTLRDAQDDKLKKRDIKKLREKGFVSARFRNFQAYMQYCVLCDKEFLGHRIIRHAQKHLTDGIYSCPICAKKFDSKERLVPHVTLHVKQSSKERLAAMKPLRRLGRPSKQAIKNEKQKPISKQEQRSVRKNSLYSDDFVVFEDDDGSDEENSINYESEKPDSNPFLKLSNDPEFSCPLLVCKKEFKYYKNLIAHVKAHKGSEEAMRYLEMQSKKVICHYCRRHFVSVAHLNDHLQMHCGSKPYMCIQMKCGASFDSNAQLLAHRKEHQEFKAKCMFPKCGRIFFESSTLYEHEAQHYHTYTCKSKGCGKVFHSQIQLERHLDSHEVKKEDEIKSQFNGTVKHIQPLVENIDIKNAPVKSEPTYNSNCISNINNASGPLNIKPVKVEPLDTVQTLTKCLDHTAIGVCTSRVLPPSKELSQVLFPTTVLNKESPQVAMSGQLLSQSSLDALEKSDASSSSSHIKKSPINQGICDIILTKEKFAAAVNMIDTGNTILSQIYTAVKDACSDSKNLPVFHDSKETGCYNQTKQDLNMSVHSGSSKIDLATQSVESKMGTVVHLGFDNQALYESSFLFPEFEDHVKTAANLLTLPSNTSNGSLFVSTQSSLGNPLVAASVLKQLPVQKFTCKIEGCSKIYNSIQSIGKHIKAAHPAQYPAFTLERKRSKRKRSRNSANAVHNAKLMFDISPQVSCSNNTVLQQLKTSDTNNTYLTDFQSLQTPVCATRLENLVNPILPSIENLNRGAKCQKPSTGTFLGAQFEDLSKPALPLKFESESDPFLPLPAEDCSLSTFSSLALHGTNAVFSSLGNNNSHEVMSQTEAAACSVFPKEEYSGYTDREFNFTGSSSTTSNTKKEGHDQSPSRKHRRHASRAKCPAIIRDGKFICRRCFRVFSSASSLGGHLSKGAHCKPIDGETELSEEHLASSKQASLLANMILSSNLQSPQSHFSPETCYKDPSFLQSLTVESQSSVFLQNLITQASSASFNSCVPGERHEIMKQPLGTAGIVGTLGCSEMLPAPSNCVVGNSPLNTMVLPCTNRSSVLDPVCHTGMMMVVDKSKTLNSESEERMQPPFATDLLKNFNNVVCSHPTLALPPPPFVASKSCRVSVISGPLNTTSSEIDSKKEGGSKITNTVAPFHEADLSKNLIASDMLTVGHLAKNVQENVGRPTSILHKNVISSCEPHLMENRTNKLNTNENNHACMGSIDDHLKQNIVLPLLVQQSIKTEKEDSKYLNSQKTEVFMDSLKAPTNVNVTVGKWEVRNHVPCDLSTVAAPDTIVNPVTNINDSPKMLATNSTQLLGSATDYSITNLTSEIAVIDDQNVVEILELLKRLKLENDLVTNGFESDTASASPPSDVCSPISPLSISACRITVQKVPDSDPSNQLLEETAKPFVCCEKACIYRAMTKDALFKHYRRVHKYTDDKLKDVKKNQSKFAPFRCVIPSCTKTFTRNSNLRTHCQAIHHFSADEMEKLRLKRPFEGSLSDGMSTTPARVRAKRMHAEVEVERKMEPLFSVHSGVKQEVDLNRPKHIPDEQACKLGLAVIKEENLQREEHTHKKIHENDGMLPAKSSPYRPYSCVHQNCSAAFTIQQNLILHYQAVHKSELPKFELEEDSETYTQHDETESSHQGKEFRCQEYDCSRIFQEAACLIQHYMKLHEMMPEEIEQVMPTTKIGRFKCDQPQCISSFTSCSNYLNHLEEDHEIKIKQCREDGIYKCDCEGCDRIYATRSNLLRHIFNKHNDKRLAHLLRRKKFFQNDEENNSNRANEYKSIKCKPRELKYDNSEKEQMRKKTVPSERNMSNIKVNPPVSPLKYGKKFLFLKTKFDALAECSENVCKQYPCMIKGCTSIVTSVHNIIRHYTSHKITRAFTLSHRSSLILCKKKPIPQVKAISSDDEVVRDKRTGINQFDESSESSDESVDSTSQLSETERDEVDELIELLDMKLIEDNGAEDQARTSSKNHDCEEAICSRPQKNNLKRVFKENVCQNKKRKIENSDAEEIPIETSSVHSGVETVAGETPEDTPAVFDLSSFKPMGFEMSFLKFLEESAVKDSDWDVPSAENKTDLDVRACSGNASGTKYPARMIPRRKTSRRKVVEEETTSEEDTSEETTSEGTADEDTAGEDTVSSDETAVGKTTGIASGAGTAVSQGVTSDERNVRRDTSGDINLSNEVYGEETSLVKGYTCLKAMCDNFICFANPSKLQFIGNVQFVLGETLKGCTKQALKQLQEMKPTVILKNLDDMHCADTVTSEQSFGEFGDICTTAN